MTFVCTSADLVFCLKLVCAYTHKYLHAVFPCWICFVTQHCLNKNMIKKEKHKNTTFKFLPHMDNWPAGWPNTDHYKGSHFSCESKISHIWDNYLKNVILVVSVHLTTMQRQVQTADQCCNLTNFWAKVALKQWHQKVSSHLCVAICWVEFDFLCRCRCRCRCVSKALHPFPFLLILVHLTKCIHTGKSDKQEAHSYFLKYLPMSCTGFIVW